MTNITKIHKILQNIINIQRKTFYIINFEKKWLKQTKIHKQVSPSCITILKEHDINFLTNQQNHTT